jgi:hypothetical protein
MLDEGSLIWAQSDSDCVIRSGRPKQSPSPRSRSRSRSRDRSRSRGRNSARTLRRRGRSGSQSHARSRRRSRDRSRSRERRSRCSRSRDRGHHTDRPARGSWDRGHRTRKRRKRGDSTASNRGRERQEERKRTGPSPVEKAAQPRGALEPAQQEEVSVELRIEDAVSRQIDACDPARTLPGADFHHVLTEVTNIVLGVMIGGARTTLDEEDRDFIRARVRTMVRPGPGASEAMVVTEEPSRQSGSQQAPTLLQRLDQVVCRLDGERVGGVVRECLPAVDEASNAENDGQRSSKPQHVVHVVVNPPDNRLIAVLKDDCHLQRTAGCDGLVCRRMRTTSTDSSDRSVQGLKRKVTHLLTYLGRVVAV